MQGAQQVRMVWVLSLALLGSAYQHRCNRMFSGMFREICPRSEDPVQDLRKLLEEKFVAQDLARDHVVDAFLQKLKSPDKPMMLHFSGPTGTGKTYLADLMSQAYFERTLFKGNLRLGRCGLLELRMESWFRYSIKPENIEKEIEKRLVRPIAEQLYMCPSSIIFIDELQHIGEEFMNRIRRFVDKKNPTVTCTTGNLKDTPVSTNKAIFILASDLNKNQNEVLKPGMTKSEAAKAVRRRASQHWGRKNVPSHKSTVPFLPLTDENIYAIIRMELKYMGSNIQETLEDLARKRKSGFVPKWVGKLIWDKDLPKTIVKGVMELYDDMTTNLGARYYMEVFGETLASFDAAELLLTQGQRAPSTTEWFQEKVKIVNDIYVKFNAGENARYLKYNARENADDDLLRVELVDFDDGFDDNFFERFEPDEL